MKPPIKWRVPIGDAFRYRIWMFWPIVLPLKLTACVFAVIVVCATVAAPIAKQKRLPTFFVISLLAFVAFVPACISVMNVLDAKRFGVFTYATFDDVDDFRVERYLPPSATNITIDKYAQGFRARFTINQAQLDLYLDELWDTYGDRSVVKRGGMMSMETVDLKSHELCFGNLGWPHLNNATEYYSPTAANGAGFSVWFSPSEGVAYERAGYW